MIGKLYVVATPIGNREDITQRALRILSEVDIIAAEDTLTSQNLLKMYGIENKLVSNHKFNETKQRDFFIKNIMAGKNIAVISDAGTPCISDPGYILVKKAIDNGIEVIGICGASAVSTALSISGFDLSSYAFYGFFPRQNRDITSLLSLLKTNEIAVSVFFESPKRIKKTLEILSNNFPNSDVCLCNDLTKLHEKVYRGNPEKVLEELLDNPKAEKGEYTLMINITHEALCCDNEISLEAMIVEEMVKSGENVKDAVKILSEKYRGKLSKKDFFDAAVRLKALI